MNPYVQYMYSYPHKTAYRTLEGIFLQDYAHLLSGSGNSLYLHIPFCQSKCGYCNLFSITGQTDSVFSRYLDTVERQARQYQEIISPYRPAFPEITIGGGTPLLLPEHLLERMFHILDTYFPSGTDRDPAIETTSSQTSHINRKLAIETAPNQTSREKLQILKQAGVTRVSMGIQSFSDQELRALGRQHQAKTAREALTLLKSFGFPCVNVDFIYGIPGQTIESLLTSLTEALSYEPDEIFLYPLYLDHEAWLQPLLTIHDALPLSLRLEEEDDEDDDSFLVPPLPVGHPVFQQYQEAYAFLRGAGYRQDSMRRFVKAQTSSPQVDIYTFFSVPQQKVPPFSECGFGNSLALGCGGRSYLGNLHFCTPYATTAEGCSRQLRRYMDTEDFSQITHGILLSEDEMKRRYVIRHLLLLPGLDIERYWQIFHSKAVDDFPPLWHWVERGYAFVYSTEHARYLTLSRYGLGLSDYLGAQLISPQIWEKMKEWKEHL